MGNPVVHFEIMARDAKREQEFYSELFGWKIDANNPMNYGLVNTGTKKGIQGGIGQVAGSQSPYVTFYIEVDDPQKYLDKAVNLGGGVIVPVTVIPNMVTYALFADPGGNMVGLVKSEPAPKQKRKPAKKTKKAKRRK
jgi:hypothetical protein